MKNERAISRFKERQRMRSVNFGNSMRSTLWLANLSHVSQVGLLILAGFGYFYTVQPLYTKALLEESIAKYEMELPSLRQKNLELKNELHVSNDVLIEVKKLVGHEKEELDKIRKELRATVLNEIKVTMETECYSLIVNADFSEIEIVKPKLVESITSCLRNSPELAPHFNTLLIEDKVEIKKQTKILSEKFARVGAKVLAEQTLQEKNMKAVSLEQKIAGIERQSKRTDLFLDVVIKGIASISLSDLPHKNLVQKR